jgi:hypothetical protein
MEEVTLHLTQQEVGILLNVLGQLPNSSNTFGLAVKIQAQVTPAPAPEAAE